MRPLGASDDSGLGDRDKRRAHGRARHARTPKTRLRRASLSRARVRPTRLPFAAVGWVCAGGVQQMQQLGASDDSQLGDGDRQRAHGRDRHAHTPKTRPQCASLARLRPTRLPFAAVGWVCAGRVLRMQQLGASEDSQFGDGDKRRAHGRARHARTPKTRPQCASLARVRPTGRPFAAVGWVCAVGILGMQQLSAHDDSGLSEGDRRGAQPRPTHARAQDTPAARLSRARAVDALALCGRRWGVHRRRSGDAAAWRN